MTAEEKIKLCGIFKVSQTQNIFDYELFKDCVIDRITLNDKQETNTNIYKK